MKKFELRILQKKDEEYVLSHLEALKIQNLISYRRIDEEEAKSPPPAGNPKGFDEALFTRQYDKIKLEIEKEQAEKKG